MLRITYVMPRGLRRIALGALIALVLVATPVAWYLGSPLFLNQTVSEAPPVGDLQTAGAALPAVTRGQFGDIDGFHKGEGTAAVYRQQNGQLALRLEDFRVTNGPDLFVYLSGHAAPTTSAQVHEGAALEVARLKGNVGSQNYELPSGVDLSQFRSVVIYCKQFSVVFSTAELGQAR